jgi:hypothetical protein
LLDLQALQKPPYLLLGEESCLGLVSRPTECAVIQTFIQEQEPVSFPEKTFDAVPSATTEQIQALVERIQRQTALHYSGKTFDALSQVTVSRDEVYGGM